MCVTKATQKAHLKKIENICKRISEHEKSARGNFEAMYLSKDDLDVVKKALACHMAVITLDMKKKG